MKKTIIGVMGPGRDATEQECCIAYEIGVVIAELGCVLLTGGVAHGVMDAASRGAKAAGGLTVGVVPYKLPSETHPLSDFVDIPIVTTLGEGRNVINALSSDIMVVVGMCPGTASEVCFAIKAGKDVILVRQYGPESRAFFTGTLKGNTFDAAGVGEVKKIIEGLLPSTNVIR